MYRTLRGLGLDLKDDRLCLGFSRAPALHEPSVSGAGAQRLCKGLGPRQAKQLHRYLLSRRREVGIRHPGSPPEEQVDWLPLGRC